MKDLSSEPWAAFADRVAQEFLEHEVTEAVVVTRNEEEDRVVTNYYNCDFEKRCAMIGHLLVDLVLGIIEANMEPDEEEEEEEEE